MINENEVYSLRQLEAFNALSPNEQLKIQTETAERIAQLNINLSPKQETFEANNIKVEVIEDYPLNKCEQLNSTINSTDLIIVPDTSIRCVLIANQLNSASVSKANPRSVTASVFKSIPIGVKQPLKTINATEQQLNNNGNARASQTVTASLIQPIVADKRDSFGKIQSNIAKPSLLPRQTVVTASLFQPRNTIAAPISPKFSSTTVNQQASRAAETMNKSFCMLSDDLSQPTCEYFNHIRSCHTHTHARRIKRKDIDCKIQIYLEYFFLFFLYNNSN